MKMNNPIFFANYGVFCESMKTRVLSTRLKIIIFALLKI